MAQTQIQEQALQQKQLQSITQQQLLQAQLIELPVTQLAERIQTEMNDNPALETSSDDDRNEWDNDAYDDTAADDDDFERQMEREERQSALDEALQNMGRDDDELPVYAGGNQNAEEREETVFGQQTSFYDQLMQQVMEMELSERQRHIMEYLIGSLDDDGLLHKSLEAISDEMAIYDNLDAPVGEIEQVLHMLQQADPPGIAARSLQECLLLQIERRKPSKATQLLQQIVTDYFDAFTKKHWDKIQQELQLDNLQTKALQKELRRLNPKPGAAMGEAVGRSMQQITPDFIVETLDDGTVTCMLNSSEVPQLQVSQSFADLLNDYQNNRDNMSRQMKEALLYTRNKVAAAQSFIEAIRTRQHTLLLTMKAIIQWQHRFFEEGDEALLRPMILKDIAQKTGLDLSTISRVSNSKYAQTRWGTFPLKFFFSDAFKTESGEELSTREIKARLRDIIEGEDKHKPLSDEAICELIGKQGYPIARRTVAKYREQLGFPVARLRKE